LKLESGSLIDDLERWKKAYKENIVALSYSSNTIELYNRSIKMFIEYSLQYEEEIKLSEIKSEYTSNDRRTGF